MKEMSLIFVNKVRKDEDDMFFIDKILQSGKQEQGVKGACMKPLKEQPNKSHCPCSHTLIEHLPILQDITKYFQLLKYNHSSHSSKSADK